MRKPFASNTSVVDELFHESQNLLMFSDRTRKG